MRFRTSRRSVTILRRNANINRLELGSWIGYLFRPVDRQTPPIDAQGFAPGLLHRWIMSFVLHPCQLFLVVLSSWVEVLDTKIVGQIPCLTAYLQESITSSESISKRRLLTPWRWSRMSELGSVIGGNYSSSLLAVRDAQARWEPLR